MIHPASLSETVDAVNEAAFYRSPVSATKRRAAAAFLAGRHDVPGTYGRLFGLFPEEQAAGIRLFTGERIYSAAARHVAGEEACRAILLLNDRQAGVRKALAAATEDMLVRLGPPGSGRANPNAQTHWLWPYRGGTYCCGTCSVSVWRHLTAGGLDRADERLARGLKCLSSCRIGDGTWRVFPYWYTLLALLEITSGEAGRELRYAAAKCEAAIRRNSSGKYSSRRQELARRVLERL